MGKAFMSDADGRARTGEWGLVGAPYGPSMQAAAAREAERIVAEAEAPEYYTETHHGITYREPVTQYCAIHGASGHGVAAYLAEALAAILPVLGALAADAQEDALAPLGWSDATIKADCAMVRVLRGAYDRNRATLVAMGAQ